MSASRQQHIDLRTASSTTASAREVSRFTVYHLSMQLSAYAHDVVDLLASVDGVKGKSR